MNTKKITEGEISPLKISSLPTRPTAPGAFGGKGYTPSEMKRAFDLLPLFIIDRLNSLIDDIELDREGGISSSIKTGIYDGHTLEKLFEDIVSGDAATYLTVSGESLFDTLAALEARINKVADDLIGKHLEIIDYTADGLSPMARRQEAESTPTTYTMERSANDVNKEEEPPAEVEYAYVYVFEGEKGDGENEL